MSSQEEKRVTVEEIIEYIKFWNDQNKLCSKTNEDIIAFIGPTKAGKSTLINCLMKKDLICRLCLITEEYTIFKADEHDGGPSIGSSGDSESFKPQCYGNFGNTDLLLWDFPGFGDNKGVQQEVANAISVKTVLCQQNSIRFILVVTFETIVKSDPFEFFKLLNSLLNISPDIAKHLILVASKMKKGNLKAALEKLLKLSFPDTGSERMTVIKKAKSVIEVLLDNGAYIEFKLPQVKENVIESAYRLPNEDIYEKVLVDTDGINTSGCNMIVSDDAKVKIVKLYDIVYSCLYWFMDIVKKAPNADVEEYLVHLRTNKKTPDLIKCVKTKILKLKAIKRYSLTLIEMLTQIGVDSSDILVFKSFEHLENLRNSYGDVVIDGGREFKLTAIHAIEKAMLLLDNEITKINPNLSMLSEADRRQMQDTENEVRDLSDKNKKGILGNIINFCSQNAGMINAVLGIAAALLLRK